MIMEIHSIFTKKNKLQLSIDNNHYEHGDFKICFSLVYSIQDIDGGPFPKKLGGIMRFTLDKRKLPFLFSNQELAHIIFLVD